MNMYFAKISFLLVLFTLPFTVLAAGAAAPAVQSTAWTFDDYLRGALSGAAGGLISGFVALFIGWMNNKNALIINQQKIDADKKIKEVEYKNNIDKINYEEKRKICAEYIALIDPTVLRSGKYDFDKALYTCSQIALLCGRQYALYAYSIHNIIVDCVELVIYPQNDIDRTSEEYTAMTNKFFRLFRVFRG